MYLLLIFNLFNYTLRIVSFFIVRNSKHPKIKFLKTIGTITICPGLKSKELLTLWPDMLSTKV